MAFSISTIPFCTSLSSRNRDRPLFPVFLGDVDSIPWLGPILAILEPLKQFGDVSRSVFFTFLVGAPCTPAPASFRRFGNAAYIFSGVIK